MRLSFVILFLGLFLADRSNANLKEIPYLFMNDQKEVVPGVFDDEKGIAFISGGKSQSWGQKIEAKKAEWEQKFPSKKVVSTYLITNDGPQQVTRDPSHPRPGVKFALTMKIKVIEPEDHVGLIIHYEKR